MYQTLLPVHQEFRIEYQFLTKVISEGETIAELLVIETFKIIHAVLVPEELRTAERCHRKCCKNINLGK